MRANKYAYPLVTILPRFIFNWENYPVFFTGSWHITLAAFSDTFRAGFLSYMALDP